MSHENPVLVILVAAAIGIVVTIVALVLVEVIARARETRRMLAVIESSGRLIGGMMLAAQGGRPEDPSDPDGDRYGPDQDPADSVPYPPSEPLPWEYGDTRPTLCRTRMCGHPECGA